MILADSLQILENEVVQDAISRAHGTGMLLGAGIMAVMMFVVILLILHIDKCEQEQVEKNHAISKYIRLKMEMSWIEMVDICKRCIEGDIRIANPVITLFNEFPNYDAERQAKEMEFFPNIANQYGVLINDRTSIVGTIEEIINRDIETIYNEMRVIERKYPEEITEYNKEHDKQRKQILKEINTNDGNTES